MFKKKRYLKKPIYFNTFLYQEINRNNQISLFLNFFQLRVHRHGMTSDDVSSICDVTTRSFPVTMAKSHAKRKRIVIRLVCYVITKTFATDLINWLKWYLSVKPFLKQVRKSLETHNLKNEIADKDNKKLYLIFFTFTSQDTRSDI